MVVSESWWLSALRLVHVMDTQTDHTRQVFAASALGRIFGVVLVHESSVVGSLNPNQEDQEFHAAILAVM